VPADGSIYKTIRQPRYAEELARLEDSQGADEIKAAEEAIARAPYEPEPKAAYKLLAPSEASDEPEPLQLMVTVRRLQVLKNGFVVSYTIREYGQLVYLEDLDLPFKYKLPKFQP
jgi:hypothetical protein